MSATPTKGLQGRRAVIYTRVSSEDQLEGYSLENQETRCRALCDSRGLEVVRVFVDEARSAKTIIKRVRFQEMVKFCSDRRNAINVVVVYHVDRFSRKILNHYLVRAELDKAGVDLVSVLQHFDKSAQGIFMEGIHVVQAEADNVARAERTTASMKMGVLKGRYLFSPPIGYSRNPFEKGKLLVDPVMGPILRDAFEMIATGAHTVAEVLKHANARGLRNRKGQPVIKSTFHYMLRKPVYAGTIIVEKWLDVPPSRADFDSLISKELFEKVQVILAGNKPTGKEHARSNPAFPLRRFVRCGTCGSSFTGSFSKSRNGTKHGYYRCVKCKRINVPKQKFEESFCACLDHLKPKDGITELFKAVVVDVWESKQSDSRKLLASLERRMRSVEIKQSKLRAAFLYKEVITQDDFKVEKARLDAEMRATQREYSDAQIDEFEVREVVAFSETLLTNARKLWRSVAGEKREKLQYVLFPEGSEYLDGKFGTSATSSAFSLLGLTAGARFRGATRHGLEP